MRTTDHFQERVKKRAGLKKKLSEHYFQKALLNGLKYEDFSLRPQFQKYLDRTIRNDCIAIIFNRHIIISSNEDVAITILDLPKEYYSTVDSIKKEKRRMGDNAQNQCNLIKDSIW